MTVHNEWVGAAAAAGGQQQPESPRRRKKKSNKRRFSSLPLSFFSCRGFFNVSGEKRRPQVITAVGGNVVGRLVVPKRLEGRKKKKKKKKKNWAPTQVSTTHRCAKGRDPNVKSEDDENKKKEESFL